MIGDAQVRRTDPFVTDEDRRGRRRSSSTGVVPAAAFRDAARDDGAGARARMPARWRRRCGASRPASCGRSCLRARSRSRATIGSIRGGSPIACEPSIPMRSRSSRRPTAGPWSARHRSCWSRGRGARCARTRWPVPRRGRATGSRIRRTQTRSRPRRRTARSTRSWSTRSRRRCDRSARRSTWDPEPVLLETANVWHLSTRFRGRLADPAPSALDLALALHPTPAVAGAPTEVARAAIGQLEGFDRGSYAGPVGWVDADGNGVWAIALRCALLRRTARRCTRGPGSSVPVSPPRSSTRPTGSSARSWTRCAGGDAMRLLHAGDDAKGWLDGPWLSDLTSRSGTRRGRRRAPPHDRSTEIYLIAAGRARSR